MNKVIKLSELLFILILNFIYSMQAQPNRLSNGATDRSNVQSNNVFKFIKTIQITPDTNYPNYKNGALGYIHYIPQSDCFVVMLSVQMKQPEGEFSGQAAAFKEFYTDMQPTRRSWVISDAAADFTTQVIGNYLYLVHMTAGPQWVGWRLEKFDPVNWIKLDSVDIHLSNPDSTVYEGDPGPQIFFINGLIDITGAYYVDGDPGNPLGQGSHHHFFTTDLAPQGVVIIKPPEYPRNTFEGYMCQTKGSDIYMIAASDFFNGDIIMLKFDKSWTLLDQKTIHKQARFPTGLVVDSNRFYIAYMDISHENIGSDDIGLAAYDSTWNLVDDVIVTTPAPNKLSDSPWLMKYGNQLYVSYVSDSGKTGLGQTFISIYDLTKNSTAIEPAHSVPKEFRLEQNYPNPFNPSTTISFTLAKASNVKLNIYNLLGQNVSSLIDRNMNAGLQSVAFDAKELSSGMYFYRLEAGSFISVKKMLLLK